CATSALQSTNAPWLVTALGWAETSTANTRTPTPTCGAASPTQPGETRMVAIRSAASWMILGSVGSTSAPGWLSTGCGAVITGRACSCTPACASSGRAASVTPATPAGCSRTPSRCSQDVHLPVPDGDLDPQLARRPGPLAGDPLGRPGGQIDLGDQGVQRA